MDVKSYGFVDLEGAKTSAIIVEYNQDIKAISVDKNDYEIIDYAIYTEKQDGFEKTIELDKDSLKGNEGQITKVYVNNKPEISKNVGTKEGKYVVIESEYSIYAYWTKFILYEYNDGWCKTDRRNYWEK